MPRRNLLQSPSSRSDQNWDLAATDPVSQIPRAEPKKRDRKWEKENPSHHYRGVPTGLRDRVKNLADQLLVTADEIARVFTEVSLKHLADGQLVLEPKPKSRRMTLFPDNEWSGWEETQGSSQPKLHRQRKSKEKSSSIPAWQNDVSYRLPRSLHAEIKRTADWLSVPVGEVMAAFLKHGYEVYQAGNLSLNTKPKTIKMTLRGGPE